MSKIKNCKKCQKKFRMIDMELSFYQKQGYPEPKYCPMCRQKRREALRNPRQFFHRKCDKCGSDMITTHRPDNGLIVYCIPCFQDYYNRVDPLAGQPTNNVKSVESNI